MTSLDEWGRRYQQAGCRFNVPGVFDAERACVEAELGTDRSDVLAYDAASRNLRAHWRYVIFEQYGAARRLWADALSEQRRTEVTRERILGWIDEMYWEIQGMLDPVPFDRRGLTTEMRALVDRYLPEKEVAAPANVIGADDLARLVGLWPGDDPELIAVEIPKRLTLHDFHPVIRTVYATLKSPRYGPSTDLARAMCNLEVEPGNARARYPGTEGYPYVEVTWRGKQFTGRALKGRCSCPVHRGRAKWCKHSSGLAFILADQAERHLVVT